MKVKLSDQAIRRISQMIGEDQEENNKDYFNYAVYELNRLGPKGPYHVKIQSDDGGETKWMLVDSEKIPTLIEWLNNVESE